MNGLAVVLVSYAFGWLVAATLLAPYLARLGSGATYAPVDLGDAIGACGIALAWPMAALAFPVWGLARLVNRRPS